MTTDQQKELKKRIRQVEIVQAILSIVALACLELGVTMAWGLAGSLILTGALFVVIAVGLGFKLAEMTRALEESR